jgi:inward rectifier potassium channel
MAPPQPQQSEVEILNAPSSALGDLYHLLMRARWIALLSVIAGLELSINLVFALAYLWLGGVANARPGSFADAFFFSVQTSGTIGYGTMYPVSMAANLLMTLQSIAALIVAALAAGLVFAKFSIPRARVEFTREVTLFDMDGEPTLAFRVANTRGNWVVEAQVRVAVLRTERSREGLLLYRMYDLRLVRDRSPAMGRSWTILHRLDEGSLLRGCTPESLARDEVELVVTVIGIDGTTMQTIHARHRYQDRDFRFGARHADMLTERPDGTLQLDYAQFHDTVGAAWSGTLAEGLKG